MESDIPRAGAEGKRFQVSGVVSVFKVIEFFTFKFLKVHGYY